MKRFSLSLAFVLLAAVMVRAVPAKKGVSRTAELAGGEAVLTLCGDEYAHWWEDEQGKAYFVNKNAAKPVASAELARVKSAGRQRMAAQNARRQKRLAAFRATNIKEQTSIKQTTNSNCSGQSTTISRGRQLTTTEQAYSGTKRGLVILVNFNDLAMADSAAQDAFNRMFNEAGYTENRHIGSVADYFSDQSYGQFDIAFDVVGPVTMSQDYAYYGQNDSYGDDLYPCTMVAEACRLVDDDVDFSNYDWDGDGEVEQVFIVYAGYGENAGASASTIWPHEWTLSEGYYYGDGEGALTLDGVTIDTYAVTCELAGTTGSTLAGIGVACHEFSHCLGFPDFYDTSYSGGWGMQAWDLLDSGSYNGPYSNGEVPAGYTAYERWAAGWLEPTVLASGMTVEAMKPLNDAPEAYVLFNANDSDEFYLLENRAADRWFAFVQSYSAPSGLLVLHVDYDAEAWEENTPNDDADHQRMTIIQANNEKGTYRWSSYSITRDQYAGHPYPYADNDSLTRFSTPAATLYNTNTDGTNYMSHGIYDITRNEDGTIAFNCGNAEQDDGTNGISNVPAGEEATAAKRIFSLSGYYLGTDLSPLPAGIYIRNNRKIIRQ
ncbi:MAG: M6 family metalloprotease domain-containing protein [Prevotella sp.]|nr:M6 family metalloprotease domain-containing protein [Prevotella sp.]